MTAHSSPSPPSSSSSSLLTPVLASGEQKIHPTNHSTESQVQTCTLFSCRTDDSLLHPLSPLHSPCSLLFAFFFFFSTLHSWCVPVMPVFILPLLHSIVLTFSFSFSFSFSLHVHVTSGAQFEWLHWAWRASLESISLMQTASPQSSFLSLSSSLSSSSSSSLCPHRVVHSWLSHEKSQKRLRKRKQLSSQSNNLLGGVLNRLNCSPSTVSEAEMQRGSWKNNSQWKEETETGERGEESF